MRSGVQPSWRCDQPGRAGWADSMASEIRWSERRVGVSANGRAVDCSCMDGPRGIDNVPHMFYILGNVLHIKSKLPPRRQPAESGGHCGSQDSFRDIAKE